ncbi:WG containing repeat-containing protein [Flexibacter flexilis DSM 6793]|uniref:WG containing repeat-containing protein n=1 Tax=Flexibacter flexilis DSM 6793 TaxID=927664 RepID=A0A1I1H163_9BACT|nr:WG repeat-containing protein [Flexibacter flexilis]SFC14920.1 WG containing repeat-containing protein [Flexibacter flexilis DSM 6793]
MAQNKTSLSTWTLHNIHNQEIGKWSCDTIFPITNSVFAYQIQHHWGLMWLPAKKVIEPTFEGIGTQSVNNNVIFKANGKYGLLSLKGYSALPPAFDSIYMTLNHIYTKNELGWQVYSGHNYKPLSAVFEAMQPASQGLRAVKPDGGCWTYTDSAGRYVLPVSFDTLEAFVNNNAIAKREGLWGVLEISGNWLQNPVYKNLTRLTDSTFLAQTDSNFAMIDLYGNAMHATKDTLRLREDGFVLQKRAVKVGLWDRNGCKIVPVELDYEQISDFNPKDSTFILSQDVCRGMAHARLGVTLPPSPKFSRIEPMAEGLARAKIGKYYGFIDLNGFVRIANRYDSVGIFSEGLTAVMLKKRWGYINRNENIIIQPLYQKALPFGRGVAIIKKKNEFGIVNANGQEVHAAALDSLYQLESGYFVSVKNKHKGILQPTGQVITYPNFDNIEHLYNGLFLVERNNKFGVYKTDGEPFIPLTYRRISYEHRFKLYCIKH